MKNILSVFILIFLLLTSCKKTEVDSIQNDYSKKLFSDKKVKEKIDSTFKLNDEKGKVLKVLLSRRNNFLRVTIFQIYSSDELSDIPLNTEIYQNSLLLIYNGEEYFSKNEENLTRNKSLINQYLKDSIKKDELQIIDSPVVQFDIEADGKFYLVDLDSVDPYDSNDSRIQVKFPPPSSK